MKTVAGICLVALLLAACGCIGGPGGIIIASGNTITKDFNLADFSKLDIGNTFQVTVSQSNTFSVSVTAKENLFDYIEVVKNGDTLSIGLDAAHSYAATSLKAVVTMPALVGIDLSGASKGTVSGFISNSALALDVSGASSLDISASAGPGQLTVSGASHIGGTMNMADATFDLSGASNVQLAGTAANIYVTCSGASRADLDGMTVHNAVVNFSGLSSGQVNLDGRLDVTLSGASSLRYLGTPTLGIQNVTGASSLARG